MEYNNIFNTLFDITPLPIILIGKQDMDFVNVNTAAIDTFGYNQEELLQMNLLDLVPKKDQQELLSQISKVRYNELTTFYLRNKKKDGTSIDFKITATMIKYQGKDCILKIAKDITLIFYEKLFLSSPIAIASLNENEKIKNINKTFVEYFNFKPEEVINKTLNDSIIPPDLIEEHNKIADKVKEGHFVQLQTKRMRKNQSLLDVLAVKFPVFIDDDFKGSFSIYLDNTEIKNTQNELNKLYSELELRISERTRELENAYNRMEMINYDLEEINKTKDKIISIISHDLRNPVSAIITSSEILLQNIATHDQEVQQFAKIINNSSVKIVKQLNELVDWSIQKTKRINFNQENKNLYEFVTLSIELLETNINQKSITINIDIDKELQVYVDPFLLRSIFQNLVTNSIKFTKKDGTISISAEKYNPNFIEVIIIDDGIGMTPEYCKSLFSDEAVISSFENEDESKKGLGLLLVKDFIEKHGGKIWVESVIGVGSTFHFTIPEGKLENTGS